MNEGKQASDQRVTGSFTGSINSNRLVGAGGGGIGANPQTGGLPIGGYDTSNGTFDIRLPDGGFEVKLADQIGMHNVTDIVHNQLAATILAGYYANPSLMGPNGWHGRFDPIADAQSQAYKLKEALQDIQETTKTFLAGRKDELSQPQTAQRSA